MQDTLRQELKSAMKARDKIKVSTLRMLLAAIKNQEVASGSSLSEDDYVKLFTREAKKRREAAELFRSGARDDMADNEEAELEIIKAFLPAALDEAAVRQIVRDLITTTGAAGMGEMGKVMGPLMGTIRGRFDGKRASAIVREELA